MPIFDNCITKSLKIAVDTLGEACKIVFLENFNGFFT
ncbi:hypothetical protein T10_5612 [Trichinella papuae]|uniref:Uncharacterized protein n=1 Tax=Trichinella papuae TaxID=268474 RepID=A0A0V1LWQ6_9BILA|nr:hypothetical protein T10_5612 [Trichinella papuae]